MRFVALVFAGALALGCGDSGDGSAGGPSGSGGVAATGGTTGFDSGLGLDSGFGADAAPDQMVGNGYPAGPYGNQVGQVLPNLEMLGYLRHDATGLATEATVATVSLADVRATSPLPYAMIHISGFT